MKKKNFCIVYVHNHEKVIEIIQDLTMKSVISRLYNRLGKIYILDSWEV